MSRAGVVVLGATALACAVAGLARADGDPASDVLAYRNVYLPYAAPSRAAASALARSVADAYAKGNRVKVAVIQSRTDLGAIPSLFGRPSQYARFLGLELTTLYIGPLLIVMPSGYGIYDGGRSTAAEQAVLGTLPPPGSRRSDDLVDDAAGAVSKLLAAGALRSKDILKPYAGLIGARVEGRAVVVRYFLSDDSGRVAATLTLDRSGRVLTTLQVPLHATSLSRAETRSLALPAGIATTGLRACVTGVDPSGNRSAKSCQKA